MNFQLCNGVGSEQMRICRCCLGKESSEALAADNNDLRQKEVYGNMLKDVFNIEIWHEPSKLQFICGSCISRIQDASAFKDMVISNEAMYLDCLKRIYDSETQPNSLKEEIKREFLEPADVMTHEDNQDGGIDDDDEILANLKCDDLKETITRKTKRKHSEKSLEYKKSRKNVKSNMEPATQNTSKLREHRGSGPILRENSLKLLAHSTATVFQWNKSRYQCFCCKEPFSDVGSLKTHTNTHTLEEIQKKIINQQNRLVKVEVSSLNCSICHNAAVNLDNLIEHLKEHSVAVGEHLLVPFKIEAKLTCQLCSEPFALFRLLNIHMNKHYQKHVCYVCGAGFSNLVFLNLHRTRSHRPIRCQKCDLTFASRTDKKHHDIDVHEAKFERKYRFPCPFCQERFFQENLRIKHLVDKHGMNKPELRCQFCSKSFLTKSLVNNHVKVVHMKEKNHECDVCHSLFYTKSDVIRHKVTHTGEKKYSCLLCSNPFASKDSLRRHMKRTHVLH